jgi:hypothetical protein
MSDTYNNEKRFVLFRQDKEGNPKRPDYRGNIVLHGARYYLSGWIREDKQGRKFLSGTVEPEREHQAPAGSRAPVETAPQPAEGDDIPF